MNIPFNYVSSLCFKNTLNKCKVLFSIKKKTFFLYFPLLFLEVDFYIFLQLLYLYVHLLTNYTYISYNQ